MKLLRGLAYVLLMLLLVYLFTGPFWPWIETVFAWFSQIFVVIGELLHL